MTDRDTSSLDELMKAPRCLAPNGWTAKMLAAALRKDPYQSRLSISPIVLRHPVTGKSGVMGEFVDDTVGEERVAVETDDAIVFIARLTNSALGTVFVPIGALTTTDSVEKENPHYGTVGPKEED